MAASIKAISLEKEMTPEEAQRAGALKEAIAKAVLEVPERDARESCLGRAHGHSNGKRARTQGSGVGA